MAFLKKTGTKLLGVAARLTRAKTLGKGATVAALLCSLVAAGKYGHAYIKKKVNDSVEKGKQEALTEIKATVNRELGKFIFECVLRWLVYLLLILLAWFIAKILNFHKDVLIAFVLLGIYAVYVIKSVRVFRWYLSFCRQNGFMLKPARIIRAYLHKAIQDRVQRRIAGLSLPERLAMNFFGPNSDKISRDLANGSMESADLRREAVARLGMWLCGWLIYALIYNRLFLFVTDIDFKAFWQPVLWPFHMIYKILAAQ